MIRRLLKYDLSYLLKFLSIFYILSIVFAALSRVFLSFENSLFWNIIGQICRGTAISMMFSSIINTFMRICVRFKQNFYGDESYLTHTLPVTKQALYISKTITAFVSTVVSFLVVFISVFIAFYSKENFEFVKFFITSSFPNGLDGSLWKIIIPTIFVVLLEFINAIQCGFSGIILGNKLNSSKVGFSILFGFAVYSATSVFGLISMILYSLFDKDFLKLFISSEIPDIFTFEKIMLLGIVIYLIIVVAIFIINNAIFKKGVNVE